MSIPYTNIHRKQKIEQAVVGVINIQRALNIEPSSLFKPIAIAQSKTIEELNSMIDTWVGQVDLIRNKLVVFRDVELANDPDILTLGNTIGISLQDVDSVGQAALTVFDEFILMPRTTYEEIVLACDHLINNVEAPQSIWD